ncbi:MAG: GlxA family transcriptional regulator [Endozoicomonas sp. (ex Botrylloides leachii)]|nr:GlxA family transcriptional regulator [Endozoicomonas sp. (ex Botrylloides leachii)]
MYRVVDNKYSRPLRFAFLLLPNFSLISFSSALEPLHKANNLLGKTTYVLHMLSVDGQPVRSSSSVNIHVQGKLDKMTDFDVLFICGSNLEGADQNGHHGIATWLQQFANTSIALGGIASGTNILASAGLLNGYRVTCDALNLEKRYPKIVFSHSSFELDKQRYTCSGGTASMDMMLALIGKQHGSHLAVTVSELVVKDWQGKLLTGKASMNDCWMKAESDPKIKEALDLMISNIEEPLGTDELACHVGISRRQLERIFRRILKTAPSKYYLRLRLEEARRLLRNSRSSIVQVALATGFSNPSHFSTAYRNHFQVTPRAERQQSRGNGTNKFREYLPI